MSASSTEAQNGSAGTPSPSPPSSDDGSEITVVPISRSPSKDPPQRRCRYDCKTFKAHYREATLRGEHTRIRGEMVPRIPFESYLDLGYAIKPMDWSFDDYAHRLHDYANELMLKELHRYNGHGRQAVVDTLVAHLKVLRKYDHLEFCEIPDMLGLYVFLFLVSTCRIEELR